MLFGSVAKGTFRKDSDIDLCIIKDTLDKSNFAHSINNTGVKIYG
ncbi:nucleotidyltransferase domain-containing protein [Hathewaya massiliensis]|nr:nucleotidyltransferase domain-containing protein [Hathewaya massiliensis]